VHVVLACRVVAVPRPIGDAVNGDVSNRAVVFFLSGRRGGDVTSKDQPKRTRTARAPKSRQDTALPKYSIAVASDLSGVPQQQLRRMEEGGLLSPLRTSGNTRRYSDDDLSQIEEVAELVEDGVNLEGIRRILALQEQITALRAENAALQQQLAEAQSSRRKRSPAQSQGSGSEFVPDCS
jgi:MerR family transcriptional regulator/heat shock protein HspR